MAAVRSGQATTGKGCGVIEARHRGIRVSGVLVGDDRALDGFGPAAVFVDAGVGFDGADDAIGSGLHGFGLLHDEFEAAAATPGALLIEAKSTGVAVDNAAIAKLEFMGDGCGTLPMEESLFNGFALGMAADRAVALVMSETDGRFWVFTAGDLVRLRRCEGDGWDCVGS